MITPPDETYTTAEAASLIGISERQCARYLKAGLIRGTRPNGRWRISWPTCQGKIQRPARNP